LTEEKDVKQEIVNAYLELLADLNRIPTYADLLDKGQDRNRIRSQFGNLTKLHEYIRSNHREVLDENVAHSEFIFNEKRLKALSDQFKDTKVFIITTAVASKPIHQGMYDTVKQYLQKRNGKLIIVASADIADRAHDHSSGWSNLTVDRRLRDEFFVTEEFKLNSNLFVSNIKVSAKQILPTTGLSRIGQTNGSYIFASPKQFLEFVATSPREKHPKAIMTTGAITVPNYSIDRWMSQRTSYIAEHDHVMGGIIVEIVDDRFFHFRHFQCNSAGEFVDLGVRYYPDGSTRKERTHLYAGDIHAGWTNEEALKATLDLCVELQVENFFAADVFDGYSVSHHHIDKPLKRAMKALNGLDNLVSEIRAGGKLINRVLDSINGEFVWIRGNHDEVLERYLDSGNYTKDFNNQYVALELAKLRLEGKDVLQEAYAQWGNINEFDRIVWLQRDDEWKIGGVECGQHGDLGSNGSKGSLNTLEKAYGHCVVGHTHSAAIMRGVYRVGTLSELSLEYNRGPSSWTHSNCLVYEDGSRQLVHVINGTTHL